MLPYADRSDGLVATFALSSLIETDSLPSVSEIWPWLQGTVIRQRQSSAKFASLKEWWDRDTALVGSVLDRFMHPAYQQIIGLGPTALEDILRALADEPDHWFWALSAISGEDPAAGTETFDEARELWLAWGRERGHIK